MPKRSATGFAPVVMIRVSSLQNLKQSPASSLGV